MCGIVVHVGRRGLDLAPALDAIRHRGPDDRGTERFQAGDQVVDLGFVRLSILDLSPAGHQPMRNEDGTAWVVFNGEIYNFAELRAELETRGHRFRSTTDTETILHAYEEYGDAFVHRLRGMFGLALWDARRERLLVVRDRLGIKPIFWSDHGGRLVVGSEIKALLALGVPREMGDEGLAAYLRYLYVPPPLTMFRHVRRLQPGHLLAWEKGRVTVSRYWDLALPVVPRDEESVVRELRARLEEAVRQHVVADVPVGVFLSGGLDSSTLVGLMARAGAAPIRTFCMTFGGEQLYDERRYARLVADHFRTEHVELPVEADVEATLPQVVRHFDEPFGNPTSLLVWALAREMRRHVTVALAGDGGDEVFLGYPRYPGAALAQQYRSWVPAILRRAVAGVISPLIRESVTGQHRWRRAREFLSSGDQPLEDMYASWDGYYSPEEIRAAVPERFSRHVPHRLEQLFAAAPEEDFRDRITYVDLKSFLPDNLLQYTDRMSMAHSLEVRVPFCDHRLVEFLAAIPFGMKVRGLTTKVLLKRAVGDLLPPEVVDRRKLGFNPPMGIWLNRELRAMVDARLDPARLGRQGIFDPAFVRGLLDAHRAGRRDLSLHLWALVVFQEWMEQYQGATS